VVAAAGGVPAADQPAVRAGRWHAGQRRQVRLDLLVQAGDGGLKGVDEIQQQADLVGVDVPEPPGECLSQLRLLGPQPAQGQPGEHLRAALACDQRAQHRPPGLAEQVRDHC